MPLYNRNCPSVLLRKKYARLYFLPAFGNRQLDAIKTEQVENYVADRLANAAPGTVKLVNVLICLYSLMSQEID